MFSVETRRELQNGNPEAYKEVFRLLYPRLKGYCKLFLDDDDEVGDIIQETFIKLWEKRDSIELNGSVESLIFIMTRNRCLNVLKNKRLESQKIDTEKLNVNDLQYLYQLDFSEKEERSLEEMLILSFQEEVEKLPAKMKTVFVKCKIENRKQQEVAEELGISIKMVEKHIARAKEQIRRQLLKKHPLLYILILLLL
ncbi:RNA polymerase sigma-70 factor, ECF subfamily [Mariniphaga anaerophila]|uniref:RNA polymerase sigma-70 factor, ECF subfamily n=1 Tax=Mariniphaga anaerophila TaxID=1484053 RepID=A0A1M5G2D7_9BACT|nr:sigma-70 family RNA polymerase sigma factor [Mariniphaga anaerophila]SHF97889.1 RNA polymerase sigma-70 factor, ECF subfamily [Mariniphaga anaerophila]